MKKVGIISCSNGLKEKDILTINKLVEILKNLNIETVKSTSLFASNDVSSGTGKERANELMRLYEDSDIDTIFDVSGGDLSNEILEYINFDIIKNNPKPFVGYSDLSVILNSIYSQTGNVSHLYQIRNIISNEENLERFSNYILGISDEIFKLKYRWVQGKSMNGIVVGGNIRCTLKLSGTKFMPDFKDKILLLESLGGDVAKMRTYLTQFKLMGVFNNINGIILGTFTEMQKNNLTPSIETLITEIVDDPTLPIIKTEDVGHGNDSKSISIGKHISL